MVIPNSTTANKQQNTCIQSEPKNLGLLFPILGAATFQKHGMKQNLRIIKL